MLSKFLLAGASGGWTPADIVTAGWWDFSDTSKLWTTSARSTNVAANDDPIGCCDDKSGNGRNAIQATAGYRPLYKSAAPAHASCDGTDDGLRATFSMTGMTDMSLWIACDVVDTVSFNLLSGAYSTYAQNGYGAGDLAMYKNGTLISPSTSDGTFDALSAAGPLVLEVRSRDISAGSYISFAQDGVVAQVKFYEILLMTMTVADANRTAIAAYMATQAGI